MKFSGPGALAAYLRQRAQALPAALEASAPALEATLAAGLTAEGDAPGASRPQDRLRLAVQRQDMVLEQQLGEVVRGVLEGKEP